MLEVFKNYKFDDFKILIDILKLYVDCVFVIIKEFFEKVSDKL